MTRVLLTAGAFSVSICKRPCTLALEFLSDESDRMMEAGPPNEAPPPWSGGRENTSKLLFRGSFCPCCLVGLAAVRAPIGEGRELARYRIRPLFWPPWESPDAWFVQEVVAHASKIVAKRRVATYRLALPKRDSF